MKRLPVGGAALSLLLLGADAAAPAPLAAQPPQPTPALPARGDTAALRRFVAGLDTATIRRLCAAPDSVAAGRVACVLRNQGAIIKVF